MKKLLLTILSVCMLTISAQAAQFNPYVSAKVSRTFMNNDVNQSTTITNIDSTSSTSTLANKNISDDVWGVRTAMGVEMPLCGGLAKSVRGEIEYGYNGETSNNGSFNYKINGHNLPTNYKLDAKIQTVFLNVYYDIQTNTKFTPYVGVGIGYANIKETARVSNQVATMSAKDSKDNLAYNIGGGVSYTLTEKISIDTGYRYTYYGTNNNDSYGIGSYDSAKRKYDSHEIMTGLRYNF